MAGWEKYLNFRCTGCGNCCRGTYLMITDTDVRRVLEGTKRPVEEILRFPKLEDVNMDKRSPWGIKMADGKRVLMTVKWRPGGACMFLQDDNRCGVYEHRPIVCRQHPFNVVFSDTGGVERLTMSRIVECPAEYDGKSSRREHARMERWSEREADTYLEQVEAWNRRRTIKRSPREWLRFIGLVPAAQPRRSMTSRANASASAP